MNLHDSSPEPDDLGATAGLYLHVPFCSWICPYCDFSVLKGDGERRRRFVETLTGEIDLIDDWSARLDTLYLGGGTPSMLAAGELEAILDAARTHLEISDDVSVSLEANPEDVDDASLAAWRRLGVSILSLGVQSFAAAELAFLGRRHDPQTAVRSVREALDAGFETVSIDLIYGLPGQDPAAWRENLERAIELAPDHLSCYQLTVHEKTVFGVRRRRGELVELDDERQAELFFDTHKRLEAAGYEGYEVSNFAAARRHRSAHNQKYWNHTPYLGLGPSAHSFDGRRRWWNEWKERAWARRVEAGERPVAGEERLSPSELAFERLMLGLRTTDGVDLGAIRRRYGVDLELANGETIDALVDEGRLERRDERLVPTLAGRAVADSLALVLARGHDT